VFFDVERFQYFLPHLSVISRRHLFSSAIRKFFPGATFGAKIIKDNHSIHVLLTPSERKRGGGRQVRNSVQTPELLADWPGPNYCLHYTHTVLLPNQMIFVSIVRFFDLIECFFSLQYRTKATLPVFSVFLASSGNFYMSNFASTVYCTLKIVQLVTTYRKTREFC
jgi:hypothetical protein